MRNRVARFELRTDRQSMVARDTEQLFRTSPGRRSRWPLIPHLKGEMWGTRLEWHIAAKGTLSQYMRLILRPGHP